VREKFLDGLLPPTEALSDYDAAGRVRLPIEYRDWLMSPSHWLAGQAAVSQTLAALSIVSPVPGSTYYLDPDLPDGGRRLTLRASGRAETYWESDSLLCQREADRTVALLREGRHRLWVLDPRSGQRAETWIVVRPL